MSEAAYEDGSNRPHERLYSEVVAEEPGYFYIYLSNDDTGGGEAFFDDFTVLNLESYIVQQTDYYPYGLVARNFVRAGEKETFELFQGKTYEQLTGWYDFHARQYDAALGRWFGVDPQSQFASPYLAMGNNPVMMVDPNGELAWFVLPAIIGAVTGGINVAQNWSAITAAGGGWGSIGAAAASFGIGFAAGAGATLGAAAAAPLLAPLGTGAASGAAFGAIGGGISGFTLGAGNTWANGGGFLNGLGAGLIGAGTGTLVGGVSGGTFSGVKSLIQGNNFWTGVPKSSTGITYNKLNVERPSLGSEYPQRELAKVEMASATRNPAARSSSFGNNTIDTGNLRIDLEMGRAVKTSTSLVTKYPANASVAGTAERTFLRPGQVIDRYGSLGGKWFSQPGISYSARSIPLGQAPYMQFKVLKPFEVIRSLASPGAFSGQTGFGVQFQSPVGADILIKRGIIAPF